MTWSKSGLSLVTAGRYFSSPPWFLGGETQSHTTRIWNCVLLSITFAHNGSHHLRVHNSWNFPLFIFYSNVVCHLRDKHFLCCNPPKAADSNALWSLVSSLVSSHEENGLTHLGKHSDTIVSKACYKGFSYVIKTVHTSILKHVLSSWSTGKLILAFKTHRAVIFRPIQHTLEAF